MMILLLDNYDSFTHILAQYLRRLGVVVEIIKSDEISIAEIAALSPEALVLSPGPGNPDEAGITLQAIEAFHQQLPILGVCLGHQAIAQCFGAKITHAKRILHGECSELHHKNKGLFKGLPQGFQVCRYHSLSIDPQTLPEELLVDAYSYGNKTKEIMAIRHQAYPVYGIQYHPEALLTDHGLEILQRFLAVISSLCDLRQ